MSYIQPHEKASSTGQSFAMSISKRLGHAIFRGTKWILGVFVFLCMIFVLFLWNLVKLLAKGIAIYNQRTIPEAPLSTAGLQQQALPRTRLRSALKTCDTEPRGFGYRYRRVHFELEDKTISEIYCYEPENSTSYLCDGIVFEEGLPTRITNPSSHAHHPGWKAVRTRSNGRSYLVRYDGVYLPPVLEGYSDNDAGSTIAAIYEVWREVPSAQGVMRRAVAEEIWRLRGVG